MIISLRVIAGLLAFSATCHADEALIASASNFRATAQLLQQAFEATDEHRVQISSASTAKLYTQIINGAPYDVFLAADSVHPDKLVQAGLASGASRRIYATGHLVVWSADPTLRDADCRAVLEHSVAGPVAIANPRLAPYGAAARQFLETAGLWESLQEQLVYGENIAQTLHFVASGNARLGVIARSQANDPRLPAGACRYDVPSSDHAPIEQAVVLLRRAETNRAALAFLEFLASDVALELIRGAGYTVPDRQENPR